jgi:hypothetical protein
MRPTKHQREGLWVKQRWNTALRLRPELPEAHLAAATHLYYCYRDFERARVQIAIAAQALPNSPDVLELTALIDQR